ncbi:hypothetical protein FB45DRAFT_872538 [Roridomyces roridus]|uniref:Uncharacterized protein n=1 Tax=Roridomyces roridus TaxID=1738132 RepID=A0AAD7FD51_9AGAR|nr:hypothetical protein FB45DRAFT_872538 [Roridomyces roridus]
MKMPKTSWPASHQPGATSRHKNRPIQPPESQKRAGSVGGRYTHRRGWVHHHWVYPLPGTYLGPTPQPYVKPNEPKAVTLFWEFDPTNTVTAPRAGRSGAPRSAGVLSQSVWWAEAKENDPGTATYPNITKLILVWSSIGHQSAGRSGLGNPRHPHTLKDSVHPQILLIPVLLHNFAPLYHPRPAATVAGGTAPFRNLHRKREFWE